MDPSRSAHRVRPLIHHVLMLLVATALIASARAQLVAPLPLTSQAQQLFSQERWQEIVHLVENSSTNVNVSTTQHRDADLDYYYGQSLAKLGRLSDARRAFLAGYQLRPRDPRFPVEIGGIDFLQKHYSESSRWLLRASRLTPRDAYVNDFNGSVFYLLGNVDAALKYWNRVSKPRVATLSSKPVPRLDPVLLDRAFAFAPASTLEFTQWQQTRERLDALEIFPSYNLVLSARPDNDFDVTLHAAQRNGFGNSALEALISTFRGAFYQTITPEYYNIRASATNVTSLLRWDAQKRRANVAISGPLHRDPRWRYRLALDLRNENWDIRNSFIGHAPVRASLNLRRAVFQANITSFHSVRWNWTTGAEISHRTLRDVISGAALPPNLLLEGWQLKHTARVQYRALYIPKRRFTISTGATSELARIWSQPAGTFFKPQAFVATHWLPRAQGDDFEMHHQARVGIIAGTTPFDELFVLGLERDNDLLLRAHIGTRDGRKGSAPLGRRYFLSNWEMDKNVYGNGLFSVKLGPFIDTGHVSDPSTLSPRKWLWDTGLQAKLRALGVDFVVSYGRDLREGRGAFYLRATH